MYWLDGSPRLPFISRCSYRLSSSRAKKFALAKDLIENQAQIVKSCVKMKNFDHWCIEASELVNLEDDFHICIPNVSLALQYYFDTMQRCLAVSISEERMEAIWLHTRFPLQLSLLLRQLARLAWNRNAWVPNEFEGLWPLLFYLSIFYWQLALLSGLHG